MASDVFLTESPLLAVVRSYWFFPSHFFQLRLSPFSPLIAVSYFCILSLSFLHLSCKPWLDSWMGRKKGGFNKATLVKMEEEKLKAEKRKKIFDYHRPAKLSGSARNPINLEGVASSTHDEAGIPLSVACSPEILGFSTIPEASAPIVPAVPIIAVPIVDLSSQISPVTCAAAVPLDVSSNKKVDANPQIDLDAGINSIWIKELLSLDYDKCQISSPNFAVQTLIACIRRREVHEFIVLKECNLPDKNKSPVSYLGFNGWFGIFVKMKKANFKLEVCKSLISNVYDDMDNLLYARTCLEDDLGKKYLIGLTHLEDVNQMKSSLQVDIEIKTDSADFMNDDVKNCLFSESDLTDEDLFNFDGDNSADPEKEEKEDDYEEVPTLTLQNSARFPIIPEQNVECDAAAWSHAIWMSQNFGALAPINIETWKALTGIVDDEIRVGVFRASKLDKYFPKKEIPLPFPISFFHQVCSKGPSSGIHVSQKGNMAFSDDKRDGFYLKKIWRTHCPFLTCGCTKINKKNGKDEVCGSSIIWLDHAVWFLLNNLEAAFPGSSPTSKMVCLTKLLHNVLKPAVLAFLSYLEVRRVMVDMTLFYAANPDSELKKVFGDTRLADIAEKTLRPISFRQSQPLKVKSSPTFRHGSSSDDPSSNFFSPRKPPRVTIDPKLVIGGNINQVGKAKKPAAGTSMDEEYSVTKGGNNDVSLDDTGLK